MSSDKVNLNQVLNHRAMAEFQKSIRPQEAGAGETPEIKELNSATNKASVRETYEKSSDAQMLEEMKLLVQAGREAMDKSPEYDEKRLAEIKDRLLNGDYDTPQVRENVSKSLARVMKILDAFVS